MELLKKNPFTTIKANDLNDTEINEQWIESNLDFKELLSPNQKISQYVLGGKGSGKTHLMRYYSYKPQMIRHHPNVLDGIVKDAYFGVYFQASGLNGDSFSQLPFENAKKDILFQYYFELYCAGLVLEAIIDINNTESFLDEEIFCKDALSLLNKSPENSIDINTLEKLKSYFESLSNDIDYVTNNAYFNPDISIEILANRGKLIFGIPSLLSKISPIFEKVTFVYFIDEMENISEDHQKYINTLLREKVLPTTFRLGARGYGIKTHATLGGGEENREGHEFEITRLDQMLNNSDNYESFAVELILNRLEKSGFINTDSHSKLSDPIHNKKFLSSFFESSNIDEILKSKSKRIEQQKISFKNRMTSKEIDEETAIKISNELFSSSDLYLTPIAIHIFSKYWSEKSRTKDELVEKSIFIGGLIKRFLKGEQVPEIKSQISYYKNNYIAKALRFSKQNNLDDYTGLENLLMATKGFPRHILTVLRNIYKIEVFSGRAPFSGQDKISVSSQKSALIEASDWFFGECKVEGTLGNKVANALSKLCELMRIECYSDKPVECSASSFTVDMSAISQESKKVLEWGRLIRVFIENDKGRQEKNSQKLVKKYDLNSLLCPKWGIPLQRRGAISFSPESFDALFDSCKDNEYKAFRKDFEDRRSIPFKVNSGIGDDQSPQIGLDY